MKPEEVKPDHFINQLDNNYERACNHAAIILNNSYKKEFRNRNILMQIRTALVEGVNPTKIMASIHNELANTYDEYDPFDLADEKFLNNL